MPRYTAAYSEFIVRLREVELLQTHAFSASRASINPANQMILSLVMALCRGGVVLLSSHIEGYIESLGDLAIERIAQRGLPKSTLGQGFRYYCSRDIIGQIKQTSSPDQIVAKFDALLFRDKDIWDINPNFTASLNSRVFIEDFNNPNHKKIKSFFKRFGYIEYENDLRRRLKADFSPCSNMMDQVISQRNKIAHGDSVATETPADLGQMIKLVKKYCRETDFIVANWFRLNKCPIR